MLGTQMQRNVELSADDHLRYAESNDQGNCKIRPSCGIKVNRRPSSVSRAGFRHAVKGLR